MEEPQAGRANETQCVIAGERATASEPSLTRACLEAADPCEVASGKLVSWPVHSEARS